MSRFERFAEWGARFTSRAPYFMFCVIMVSLWLAQGLFRIATGGWQSFLEDKFQLEINTSTTIITFLVVALIQNAQQRDAIATHKKLDATLELLRELKDTSDEIADQAIGVEKNTSADE